MKQYHDIKERFPDAILLFRVGDFYETFEKDAIITAKTLGIVLTKRANGKASHIELAGFPHHALDAYLPKLVKAGLRVAICDQLEDPKLTREIVKRGVTELVTPGVTSNEKILEGNTNNFLAALHLTSTQTGLSLLDVSTGEFLATQGNSDHIDRILKSFAPAEIIFPKTKRKEVVELLGDRYYTYPLEDWIFDGQLTRDKLLEHFNTRSLKGFGFQELEFASIAAGAILHYMGETEHDKLQHITKLGHLPGNDHVWMDRFTLRNLELLETRASDGKSLYDILNLTEASMGARLLQRWIAFPLLSQTEIEKRLDKVEQLIKDPEMAEVLGIQIAAVGDLERLIAKAPLNKISPREVAQLRLSLEAIGIIKTLIAKQKVLKTLSLDACEKLQEELRKQLVENPPAQLHKGEVIASGINKELDELREISRSGKDFLDTIQARESEKTGISSLKIGYNNVFGYYLEVTNSHKQKVPAEWIRKQTLVNAERYITEELKEYEEKIIGATEKIMSLEARLFSDLVEGLNHYIKPIQQSALHIGELDCLLCFSKLALRNNYHRPLITDKRSLEIQAGRHPVIEQLLEAGSEYVPNDITLDPDLEQILIITGPNMSGKSALLRQTALICIMAQMGSFVPAQSAKIGLVDRIFSRVGATDNISQGESTFMIEMNETAAIMNNISPKSLILLDEIGRGTSTYDGISIAWSIAAYLHESNIQPKTLFATHYHELNELEDRYEHIQNYHVSVKDTGKQVIFLRKLLKGGSAHSFGIHVAGMAGMPKQILADAKVILAQMEKTALGEGAMLLNEPARDDYQLNIFQIDDPKLQLLKKMLEDVDVDQMTPMEALQKLQELKQSSSD